MCNSRFNLEADVVQVPAIDVDSDEYDGDGDGDDMDDLRMMDETSGDVGDEDDEDDELLYRG